MAEETSREVVNYSRIAVLEERVNSINTKIDDLKTIATGMADMKDAILRLTMIQEQMQEDSRKRDLQFIEYAANAERQWKKIAKTDVRLETMSASITKVTDDFKEYKKSADAQADNDRKAKQDLHKTKIQGR